MCIVDGAVAQLVEQRPEEPCVTGSSPVGATTPEYFTYVRIQKEGATVATRAAQYQIV